MKLKNVKVGGVYIVKFDHPCCTPLEKGQEVTVQTIYSNGAVHINDHEGYPWVVTEDCLKKIKEARE